MATIINVRPFNRWAFHKPLNSPEEPKDESFGEYWVRLEREHIRGFRSEVLKIWGLDPTVCYKIHLWQEKVFSTYRVDWDESLNCHWVRLYTWGSKLFWRVEIVDPDKGGRFVHVGERT